MARLIDARALDVVFLAAYSAAATYAVGDYVYQAGSVYKCSAAVAAQAFTAGNWARLSPGPLALDATVLLVNAGGDFAGGLLTTGRVITNSTAVSGGIIDANGDSFLSFDAVDNWAVYSSAANRSAATNTASSGARADIFRFNYSASTTYYLSLVFSGETILKNVAPSSPGQTLVTLSSVSLLNNLTAKLVSVAGDVTAARDHSRAANLQTQKV